MFLVLKSILRSTFYPLPNIGEVYVRVSTADSDNPWAPPAPTFIVIEVAKGWVKFRRQEDNGFYPFGEYSRANFNFFYKLYNKGE